ncbi:MAG: hypothetical protein L5655_00685 [Thermosediminibacteraceae bacterium]|nr:hypothetical protein [Thermosediminibacteraceae bacterium]
MSKAFPSEYKYHVKDFDRWGWSGGASLEYKESVGDCSGSYRGGHSNYPLTILDMDVGFG